MRKKLIAGNWKMHKEPIEAYNFIKSLCKEINEINIVDVAVFPPFIDLQIVRDTILENKITISLGAQNMYFESKGAFTGEISPKMLKSAGVEMVILGHSERRNIFNETNDFINKKVKSALENEIVPVLCIGEKLEQRENEETESILAEQLTNCLHDISCSNPNQILIAYEPVWAIGTGVNATPQQAQDTHLFIRKLISDIWNHDIANEIRILYGGSVKPSNAKELLSQLDVDGALIGGASLDVKSFSEIINIATNIKK